MARAPRCSVSVERRTVSITKLTWELTAYIPMQRWKDIEHLLPSGYTKMRAAGYWEGVQEDVIILTVFGAYAPLNRLRLALAHTLLDEGEQAVLVKLDRVRARIYSR